MGGEGEGGGGEDLIQKNKSKHKLGLSTEERFTTLVAGQTAIWEETGEEDNYTVSCKSIDVLE